MYKGEFVVDADEVPTLQRWPEQYRRMLDRRARLNAPADDDERRREDFYDFFVVTYHMADWIKNDDVVDQKVRDAAWALRKTGNIGLAGDVANGFKHLKRDRSANIDAGAHISVLPDRLFQPGTAQPDMAQLGTIVIAGVQTCERAFEIADRCIAEWDAFLREHGLHSE